MHRLLTSLLILPAALHAGDGEPAAKPKRIAALSLLPDGSRLHGVMFPRYDENLRLTATLQAGEMTLVNENTVSGTNISIRFFEKNGSQKARVDLANAWLDQSQNLIRTPEPVTIHSNAASAKGAGLCYSLDTTRGFLIGPVQTWFHIPQQATAMTTRPSTRTATATLGMALLTLPAAATPSKDAPAAPEIRLANRETRNQLRDDLDASDAATAAAREFLENADLLASQPDPESSSPNQLKPLDVSPDKDDTVVSSDNGMFFDAEKGIFVFLRNVRVTDPRFELSGASELKIFLEQKQPQSSDTPPRNGPVTARFGDVERIIATGAVRLLQKQPEPGKQPVEASGAIFTYHPKTGNITLSGGYPWVRQGDTFMRAQQPNLTLRIQKDGSFTTEGQWEMGGKINQSN